ncbi:alpha-ketoglutarate dehydrogenase subunit 4, mitochondrial [Trichomonascus vanleenenianus]|uniref:alpha-ketoglutarate dehydrogenase subunit KGD4 n=1 Tax=Trichomonascus vanleenenianus TaxID=2268995 RepID=UPI003ECB2E0C
MRPTQITLRTPLIRFLGKRTFPEVDHTPRVHPASPYKELPPSFTSFAAYRKNAQTHGPLGGKGRPIEAAPGEFFARRDLPPRLQYKGFSDAEIDNINSGGAEIVY